MRLRKSDKGKSRLSCKTVRTSLTLDVLAVGSLLIFATKEEVASLFIWLPIILASTWVPLSSASSERIVLRIFSIKEKLLSFLTSSVAWIICFWILIKSRLGIGLVDLDSPFVDFFRVPPYFWEIAAFFFIKSSFSIINDVLLQFRCYLRKQCLDKLLMEKC